MEKIIRRTFAHKTKHGHTQINIDFAYYYPRLADWYLTAEPETYQWLLDNVENNWTCIEVGAHIGEVAMLLSRISSRVICFEASQTTATMFRKNIEYNQKKNEWHYLNIDLIVRPVGSVEGVAKEKLWITGKDDEFGETLGEYDFLTLNQFVRVRDDVRWVNLIFVDADGWDYDVLLGSDFLIREFRPYIIIEANYALKWRGHSIDDVYKWAEINKYDCVFLDAGCPGNLLLLPCSEGLIK